jgi:hypothetical protein
MLAEHTQKDSHCTPKPATVPPVLSLDAITSLRGSLILLRRRCGKPNCHCAKGRPHTTPALSFSHKGKTRILTLTKADLPSVRRALSHYHKAQARSDRQASQGLRLLERYLRQARKA